MALNRRFFLLALPLTAGAASACSSSGRRLRAVSGYAEIAAGGPASTTKGTILVVMPETAQTKEVWTGLADELGGEYRLIAISAEGKASAPVIAEAIRRHAPKALVLMNNPTVVAYRAYQHESGLTHFPPAVIVMTSFLDGGSTQIVGAVGISYEVPLITVVTNLRKLIASPIEKVGVIVRGSQRDFVMRQAALAGREQISVIAEDVSANPNSSELKWALRRLKHRVDALWILNDDRLLTPRLIADGWLAGLNERPFRPTIVGAASLVSSGQSFGTFAMLPDHTALGTQTASILFNLADNNWIVSTAGVVDAPLSTTTTMDLVQVKERFALREDALRQVDRILE